MWTCEYVVCRNSVVCLVRMYVIFRVSRSNPRHRGAKNVITDRAMVLLCCVQVHVLQEQAKRPRLCNPAAAPRPARKPTEKGPEGSAPQRQPFSETTNHNNR